MKIRKPRAIGVLLALLLGSLGVHKFYINKLWQGFLYMLFSWTFIPAFLGLIEGVVWLLMTDEEWEAKYADELIFTL